MTRIDVDLPEAPWVAVPLDGDPEEWALATAGELCAELEPPGGLAAELAAVARQARLLDALAAAALVPEELPQLVLAVLVVQHVRCGTDAGAVLEELAAEERNDLGTPALECVQLPVGAAVRLHGVTGSAGGNVVERVEHVVPFGDGTGLRADLSWGALAVGEALVELADGAARGLRLVHG